MAVTLQSPTQIGGTYALLHGQGQNVPTTNKMRFDIALSASGPWNVYSSPAFTGLNIPAQNIQNQVPANTLDGETTYYVRLVELDAGNAIVNTSTIGSFETVSDGEIVLSCFAPCAKNAGESWPSVPWPDCIPVGVPCTP